MRRARCERVELNSMIFTEELLSTQELCGNADKVTALKCCWSEGTQATHANREIQNLKLFFVGWY